jgi:hypothetical protein
MSPLASLDMTMKEWLGESHDNSEYINGVIATFGDRPGAFLVLDEYPADLLLDKKELRRLGQGPDRALTRHVQRIVSHLRVVDNALTDPGLCSRVRNIRSFRNTTMDIVLSQR